MVQVTIKFHTRQLHELAGAIYYVFCFLAPHPCVDTCSHLCLLKPGGYKCACPDDYDANCVEKVNVTSECCYFCVFTRFRNTAAFTNITRPQRRLKDNLSETKMRERVTISLVYPRSVPMKKVNLANNQVWSSCNHTPPALGLDMR